MRIVTYSHARNALKTVLDSVVQDADVTIISRRDAEGDAVVMSLDHYNSLMETLHLLQSPANAAHLALSIKQLRSGKAKSRSLSPASCGCLCSPPQHGRITSGGRDRTGKPCAGSIPLLKRLRAIRSPA